MKSAINSSKKKSKIRPFSHNIDTSCIDVSYLKKIKKQIRDNNRKHPIIEYFKRYRKRIVSVLHNATSSIPDHMHTMDNRMDISQLIIHEFLKEFQGKRKKVFCFVDNRHYDLIFRNEVRLSFKSASAIFQKDNSNGIKGEPHSIILKNCLNGNNKFQKKEWDYLISIQRQDESKDRKFGIGIATFETIMLCMDDMDIEQVPEVRCKVYNDQWDYFYECPEFFPEKNKEKLDKIYKKCKQEMFNKLGKVSFEQ